MAMFKLSERKDDFENVPEGRHTFKVAKAEYDEDTGLIKVRLATKDGLLAFNTFHVLNSDLSRNEKASAAFSWFARVILHIEDDDDTSEIDVDNLEGRYVSANVKWVPGKNDPSKTFTQLGDYQQASSFDDTLNAVEDSNDDFEV